MFNVFASFSMVMAYALGVVNFLGLLMLLEISNFIIVQQFFKLS